MAITRHELSPRPAHPDSRSETLTRVVIGWDSLFSAYYLHIWTEEHPIPNGHPSIAYTDEIRFPPDPTAIIGQARQYTSIPDELPAVLTRDAATEGFYTGPQYASSTGDTLTDACGEIREHLGLTDCPF
ncbi:hypothetical protein [Paractinoplanes toevensis]|uniref:Uncharacterized protein n=1 Tax=Paractinoplanes toevensis TaxID=571911 RepID=A0A919WDD9_9ACTN|nr:hypothetical protein [Actinoplanes toevensis]GIM98066.1 hypothetical protein Ato02nite_098590 [Actinoplanes toevensis]